MLRALKVSVALSKNALAYEFDVLRRAAAVGAPVIDAVEGSLTFFEGGDEGGGGVIYYGGGFLLQHVCARAPIRREAHCIAAFAALTFLAALGFAGLRLRVIFVAMAALGLAMEVLQMIPTLHRDAQASDWLADCAATVAALLLCGALRSLSRRRQV